MGSVRVGDLLDALAERLEIREIRGGRGIGREIAHSGAGRLFSGGGESSALPGAVLIVGNGDDFLPAGADLRIPDLCGISLVVFAGGAVPEEPGLQILVEKGIPSCCSPLDQHVVLSRIKGFLREKIDSRKFVHGVFVLISGVGVLLTGKSGAGKSECALELVKRGQKLIADDIVMLCRRGDRIFGRSPAASRGILHIRGEGLIDIRKRYGEGAFSEEERVDLVMELTAPEDCISSTCPVRRYAVMDVGMPLLTMPAGRDGIAALVEDAAAKHRRPEATGPPGGGGL
jgi:HPr kinase/phosphorylase